jgi:hypothetical protein
MNFEQMEELRALQYDKFLEKIAVKYGIKLKSIMALLTFYELHPRGAYGPSDDDPTPLKIKEISEDIGLPQDVIYRFQDDKVVNRPLTYGDIVTLEIIKIFWGKTFYLKKQIAKLSKKKREELITRPEFATKWETWIYSIYIKNEIAYGIGGRMIDPMKRIRIEHLAQTIESMFGVPDCYDLRERIKKIREIAYNDKKKVKDRSATIESLCIARGVPLNRVYLEIGDGDDVLYS